MMRRGIAAIAVAVGALILGILILIGSGAASKPGCGGGSGPSPVGQPQLIQYYIQAAAKYNLGPEGYAYLASINQTETSFGANLAVSSAGAVGWMQFEPSTWAEYRVTPSGSPAPDDASGWNDPGDAIFTAAKYLSADGAPGSWSGAIYDYNHAAWYVKEITSGAASFLGTDGLHAISVAIANAYHTSAQPLPVGLTTTPTGTATNGTATNGTATNGTTTNGTTTSPSGPGCVGSEPVPITSGPNAKILSNGLAAAPADAPQAVKNLIAGGNEIIDKPYPVPDVHFDGGDLSQLWPAYDCSASVSFALYKAGLRSVTATDSTGLESYGDSGPGTSVTIFANVAHTWLVVDGIALDTSNSYSPSYGGNTPEPPGSGPRWITASAAEGYELTVGEDASSYVERHPPGL